MSLQGSLETFGLPDVLVMLASTKKDGELQVAGDRIEGKVWLEKGQIVHTKIGAREGSAVDTVFELLRLDTGNFSFDAGSAAPRRDDPQPIDSVLADAQVQLGEWREIAKVVPNLDAVVDMAKSAPGEEVVVSADQWRLLRTIAGGRSVHEVMTEIDGSEFTTCKTVKELVEQGLASIDVAPKAKARAARAAAQAPAPAPAPDEVARPEPEAPRPERQAAPAPAPAPAAARRPADPPKADALDALAELASRPRPKVRASMTPQGEEGTGPRPAAMRRDDFAEAVAEPEPAAASAAPEAPPATQTPEEAKALVAQLAALGGEPEEKVAEKVAEHLAQGGELPAAEGDEPINRGLLLKFLSSVRN